jgi:SAM-dependent methyltransferase
VSSTANAFDAMAASYDAAFTHTRIGSHMRAAVWARCRAKFAPGSRILEMNCGTGEDARWLTGRGMKVLATDNSAGMLEVARRKSPAAHAPGDLRYERLAWEDLAALDEPPFDGMLSNFGGLNCVADLGAAARALASRLAPQAVALLCVMGPRVPWEWAWYLARGRATKAFRRLHAAGVPWQGITIRYPSIRALRASFAPQFRCLRVAALGAVLPPPYCEAALGRFPRLLDGLNRVERRLETRWPLPQLADHYLIELQRL